MSRITTTLMTAAVLLVSTAWQGVALSATTAAPAESITVRFADLDLNKTADAAILYHRIYSAAERVCGERELPGSYFQSPAWERCVTLAVNQAVAQVDRPALNAYHRQYSADLARKG
jgi:UrcA family protein